MNVLAGFVLLVSIIAALYLVAVIRGAPRASTGGRHRARRNVSPMRQWDDTGPLPLAEIAMQAARTRRSSC